MVFFITLNEGYEYVGTNPVDEALRDRMTYSIRMSYVPKRVETSTLVKRTSVDDVDRTALLQALQIIGKVDDDDS